MHKLCPAFTGDGLPLQWMYIRLGCFANTTITSDTTADATCRNQPVHMPHLTQQWLRPRSLWHGRFPMLCSSACGLLQWCQLAGRLVLPQRGNTCTIFFAAMVSVRCGVAACPAHTMHMLGLQLFGMRLTHRGGLNVSATFA